MTQPTPRAVTLEQCVEWLEQVRTMPEKRPYIDALLAHLRAPEVTALCVECGQQVVSPRPAESAAEVCTLCHGKKGWDHYDPRGAYSWITCHKCSEPTSSKSIAKRIAAQRDAQPEPFPYTDKPDWGNRE